MNEEHLHPPLKKDVFLTKEEATEILHHLDNLKRILLTEVDCSPKENIILHHINGAGRIIANK